jgi:cytochrome c biogenesis protein CcmG/thiol:disulfide interchange protein DsbE
MRAGRSWRTPAATSRELEGRNSSMKARWIAAAIVALAIAAVTVPALLTGSDDEAESTAGAVTTAPSCKSPQGKATLDLKLKDMNGATVNLADYKGKVILLNFWATWCGPCKVEIPEFVRAYDQYKDKGLVVLGVSIDDTPDQLKAFAKQYRITYPMLLNQENVEEAYGPLYAVPVSFFIARDGSICRKQMGEVKKEVLERELRSLL